MAKNNNNNLPPYTYGVPYKAVYNAKYKNINLNNKISYALNELNGLLVYENLPDTINPRCLNFALQTQGFVIGFKNVDGNLYALPGTRGGIPDVNLEPTQAIITNVALEPTSQTFEIGKNCVIIRNDSLCIGLIPLLARYCGALVENELSLDMIVKNGRSQTVLSAGDNATIESAKEYIRKKEDGEIGVITNPKWLIESGLTSQDLGTGNLGPMLLALIEYEQYLLGTMKNSLGIRAPFNMKREALGDSEINQMDMSLLPLIDDIIKNAQKSWDEFNKMFGTNVIVKLGGVWATIHSEVAHGEEGNVVTDDTLETVNDDPHEVINEENDNTEAKLQSDETEQEKEEVKYDRKEDT